MTWWERPGQWIAPLVLKIRPERLRADYQAVFGSAAGQRVLADLHRVAGVMHDSLDLPSDKLHEVAGAQAIVYHIDRMLRLKPVDLQELANIEAVHD